jgi:AcrR family transcriptional regulator
MSNRRARQAAETKSEILGAARSLFAERGYAATSVKAIAEKADVSVQTVYDSVGSKADLVRQLNDHIDDEVGVGEIAGAIPTETDPRALVAIPVRITAALIEKCGDIVRASASGSAADPALHRASAVGFERHADGAARVAARLAALGALRAGLSSDDDASTIAVITDSWFAVRLVDEYGWTPDRFQRWAVDTLVRAVLEP